MDLRRKTKRFVQVLIQKFHVNGCKGFIDFQDIEGKQD